MLFVCVCVRVTLCRLCAQSDVWLVLDSFDLHTHTENAQKMDEESEEGEDDVLVVATNKSSRSTHTNTKNVSFLSLAQAFNCESVCLFVCLVA